MKRIVALHGQLGMASDWECIAERARIKGYDFDSLDLWPYLNEQEKEISEFGELLNSEVESDKPILIGYSMGGRLAMHALTQDPNKWGVAVIVSAHFGMDSIDDRLARRKKDDVWSEKVLSMPWEEFLMEWNKQPVLSAGSEKLADRKALVSYREAVSRSFKCWSLAEQECLLPKLRDVDVPILFVVGENDKKFYDHNMKMMESLQQPNVSLVSVPNTGHRVPWESEELFLDIMMEWLNQQS